MHLFFLLLLLFYTVPGFGSEHMSDHESFCANDKSISCDLYLQQQLAGTQPYSAQWYKITAYQLDYFYDHHEFDELQRNIELLLAEKRLPQSFAVQLYFYYAKILNRLKKRDEAQVYANKAMVELDQIYQMFGEPFRLLELANLQHQFGASDKAAEILTYTEQRFAKSKDPLFRFELNATKALLSHAAGNLQQAATERQLSLTAALALGHNGKLIVAYGNLARTFQLLGQLEQARDLYLASLPYLQAENNLIMAAIYQLRLAEIYWQLKDSTNARLYLAKVNRLKLSDSHLQLYQQLSRELQLSKTPAST
ncbi:MAG TPA: hypothetical protein DF774_17855 [Rheinheimera sp.]|uniref:hypothetical protein n=1 Tax=Rheinheimera sp. TaxID=1869214 RepID=UPI000EB9369D|nr:hypothetical protein [Rheinheimera sp.]HCU67619.1 hypothetical protein [Rheinheimera sp.]